MAVPVVLGEGHGDDPSSVPLDLVSRHGSRHKVEFHAVMMFEKSRLAIPKKTDAMQHDTETKFDGQSVNVSVPRTNRGHPQQEIEITSADSEVLCILPCKLNVDRHQGPFFFAGPGLSESAQFYLAGEGRPLSFVVDEGSSRAWAAGMTLTVLGTVGAFSGIALLAVNGDEQHTYGFGAATFGGSSVVLGLGTFLLFQGRTTFSVKW